jgi:secreted PhoX family phosphatase
VAKDFARMEGSNRSANNTMGHIIQWTEGGDVFACPNGLTLDARGMLLIQTDISSGEKHRGDPQVIDPARGIGSVTSV